MDRADHVGGLEDEIAHLRGFDLDGLRARWRSLTGRAAPAQLPRALLLGALAYRVQAAALGDLDRASATRRNASDEAFRYGRLGCFRRGARPMCKRCDVARFTRRGLFSLG